MGASGRASRAEADRGAASRRPQLPEYSSPFGLRACLPRRAWSHQNEKIVNSRAQVDITSEGMAGDGIALAIPDNDRDTRPNGHIAATQH